MLPDVNRFVEKANIEQSYLFLYFSDQTVLCNGTILKCRRGMHTPVIPPYGIHNQMTQTGKLKTCNDVYLLKY